MANEKKGNKVDPEAARRKKEEAARRGRRRNRQLLGFVLTILIVVGAVSIIGSGIDLVRSLTDDTSERAVYRQRVETMVWFDVLPFNDISTVDEATLKQVAIWGVYNDQREDLETNEYGERLIPVLEVDRYAQSLFGPDFHFGNHESFVEPDTAMTYEFLEDLQVYLLPITSMQAEYLPVVVEMARLSGGGRRVTVGYASTTGSGGDLVLEVDYDHPAKYMDFIFYRDGNSYYLQSLERNTTYEAPTPATTTTTTTPVVDDDPVSSVVEEDIMSVPNDSSTPETTTSDEPQDEPQDDMQDESAPED